MQKLTLAHSIRQIFLAAAGFSMAIMLIDSDGLRNWADRLPPGALRTVAAPATGAINKFLQPLGLSAMRERALDETARLGWTDDAARLAHNTPAPVSPPLGSAASAVVAPPVAVPKSPARPAHSATRIPARVATTPLVSALPPATALVPLPPVEPGRPRVVVLTGDSMMAVGLSATLMRQAAGDTNLRIVKAFRSGTGLARPDVFDWMEEYPAMVGPEKPDVVIVSIGTNDGQGFVVGSKVQAFGTEDWRKTYQSRVSEFLALVESSGARVVWVGLPPMRSPALNEKIGVINRIEYTVVSQYPRATWWNSAPFVADEFGQFREFMALSNGRNIHLRADDGIHFSDDGAALMTSVLMKWLDPPLETGSNVPISGEDAASHDRPVGVAF